MEEVPQRTSLAPFAFPCCSVLCLKGVETEGLQDYQALAAEGGDHIHCTVEPSPGHIRCRIKTTIVAEMTAK